MSLTSTRIPSEPAVFPSFGSLIAFLIPSLDGVSQLTSSSISAGWMSGSLESHSLLPSSNIKLEPACEADSVPCSTREIISEVEGFDKMDSKIPAHVKIEPPEVDVDYPGEDMGSMESHSLLPSTNIKLEPACEADDVPCSTREIISEVEGFNKMDSKIPTHVKIEPPEVDVDYPGEDKEIHPCSQSCPSLEEQSQTEKKMVFSDTNRKCVNLSSMIEVSTTLSLANGKCQLDNAETPVKHTQISETPLDYSIRYTSCSPQRIQAGDTPHMSDVCDVTINEDTFLHRRKTTDTGEKPHKCDICAASFTYPSHMKYHMRTHTGEKPCKCDICDVSFTKASSLKRHMRTHTGERPYRCDVCAMSFIQSGNLKLHMRTHTGEKPYKCDLCSVSYTQPGDLKRHIRSHTGEKPYKCIVCAALYAHAGGLKYHMRTHTGERPYKCDICGSSFIQAGSLKLHMRTHTGEKPYKCDICGASFTRSGHLVCHIRTHTGEKPYKCDICGASFVETGSLNGHMRTHTGEKPYKCDICASSFTQAGSLNRHMKTHTGENP